MRQGCPSAHSAALVAALRSALTREFLPAVVINHAGDGFLLDLQRKGGEYAMRAYHVRVFLPQSIEIQAEDEREALAKVGELYQELYAKELHDLIYPEQLPEDVV
jgi:hypothetical protein